MNFEQNGARQQAHEKGDFDLFDLMIALTKKKKLIIGLPLAAALVAALVTTVLPEEFQATAKLLPPQQQSNASLLSQLGGMAALAGIGNLKTPNDVYIGMLKSRTVADRLIAQFDLKTVYGANGMEKARKTLERNTEILAQKDGIMTITVVDEDQKRVARIANAYVDELTRLTRSLAVTDAAQRRLFFERQLELAKNNLAAAEMKLTGNLETTGVISVDSNSRAIIETIARLRAQISAKEIQLNSMSAFVTSNNQDYKRVQEELSSARAELSRLENGKPGRDEQVNTANSKQPGLENVRTLRDVKYYQMLYELLAKQYEVARLEEAKDTSIIQVLDPAIMPERKFKPNRTLIVAIAAILGALAAIAWATASTLMERALKTPKVARQVAELKGNLKFR